MQAKKRLNLLTLAGYKTENNQTAEYQYDTWLF